MTSVAVVAHQNKSLGGGLPELRRLLADRGVDNPLWYEVAKSRKAPRQALRAVEQGADLVLLWGGDGTVQRCLDALAGSDVAVAVIPAGTANLLAGNLGIPTDLTRAVDIALDGDRRPIDLGVINGERFAVMAGAGFDAIMMKEADRGLKDRLGQLAYVWTGTKAVRARPVQMSIKVDGSRWFKGRASCLLLGNMGTLTGGLEPFPDARPDDGLLEIGVVTASNPVQWARVLGRLVTGKAERSKNVRIGRGASGLGQSRHQGSLRAGRRARPSAKRLRVRIEPRAVRLCVPEKAGS